MDSKLNEMMSSLVDGELEQQFDEAEIDALLREMEDQQAQQDWDLYQHIGAALRGEEAFARNTSLLARVTAQLELEPAHSLSALDAAPAVTTAVPVAISKLAPVQEKTEPTPSPKGQWWQSWRAAFVAAAAASMAALGMMGGSQLLTVASNDAVQGAPNSPVKLAAAPDSHKPVTLLAKSVASSGAGANLETRQRVIADGKPAEVVMLRDPEIDQYLLAHQRFSPSLYSTAQYARSATFATDKDK